MFQHFFYCSYTALPNSAQTAHKQSIHYDQTMQSPLDEHHSPDDIEETFEMDSSDDELCMF